MHAVDAGGPGDHRLDEVLVAGHIDDADLEVGDDARGEAELDGHAAFLLLLEPVRVAAGEELDQRGLAVVDVPGRAERDVDLRRRHGPHAPFAPRISTSALTTSVSSPVLERPGVEQHLVVLDAREDGGVLRRRRAASCVGVDLASASIATSDVGRFCVGQRAAAHLEKPSTTVHVAPGACFADRVGDAPRLAPQCRRRRARASAAWAPRAARVPRRGRASASPRAPRA